MLGLLAIWTRQHGFGALVKYYLIPYLVGSILFFTYIYAFTHSLPFQLANQWYVVSI